MSIDVFDNTWNAKMPPGGIWILFIIFYIFIIVHTGAAKTELDKLIALKRNQTQARGGKVMDE